MEALKSFLDQSLLIWKDSTAAARFGIGLLLVICVGSIIGVGFWSSQPQYVQLAGDLDPAAVLAHAAALAACDVAWFFRLKAGTFRQRPGARRKNALIPSVEFP